MLLKFNWGTHIKRTFPILTPDSLIVCITISVNLYQYGWSGLESSKNFKSNMKEVLYFFTIWKNKKTILNYDPCLPVCFCMFFLLNDVNLSTKLYVIKKSTLFGNLDSDKNIVYLQCWTCRYCQMNWKKNNNPLAYWCIQCHSNPLSLAVV